MPNRLIREGLMESEAVLSLPVEGRWLFVIILLSADDVGLFEATEFKLARRADVNRDLAGKLMQMLADADLIRLYVIDKKRYGIIPKFRQRLQIKSTKHPLPPSTLFKDDPDALAQFTALGCEVVGAFGKEWDALREQVFERDSYRCVRCSSGEKLTAHHLKPESKGGGHEVENLTTLCSSCNAWARNNEQRCNEINDLVVSQVTAKHLHRISNATAQRSESESEVEAKGNTSESSTPRRRRKAGDRLSPCPFDGITSLYHEVLPELPGVTVLKPGGKRHKAIQGLWTWVMTSKRKDGERRATTESEGLSWMRDYFTRARDSDWIMGRTPRGEGHEKWEADLDYLCSEAGMKRVIERTRA